MSGPLVMQKHRWVANLYAPLKSAMIFPLILTEKPQMTTPHNVRDHQCTLLRYFCRHFHLSASGFSILPNLCTTLYSLCPVLCLGGKVCFMEFLFCILLITFSRPTCHTGHSLALVSRQDPIKPPTPPLLVVKA